METEKDGLWSHSLENIDDNDRWKINSRWQTTIVENKLLGNDDDERSTFQNKQNTSKQSLLGWRQDEVSDVVTSGLVSELRLRLNLTQHARDLPNWRQHVSRDVVCSPSTKVMSRHQTLSQATVIGATDTLPHSLGPTLVVSVSHCELWFGGNLLPHGVSLSRQQCWIEWAVLIPSSSLAAASLLWFYSSNWI